MSHFSSFQKTTANKDQNGRPAKTMRHSEAHGLPKRWSMGILNDPSTRQVPGSVILFTKPLAESGREADTQSDFSQDQGTNEIKKTADGKIILFPQPDDSCYDPLNWSQRRKLFALYSIGFYSMIGGGMTPLLAAGFTDIASTFHVDVSRVSLTTGVYMLGLGFGSVIASPTAILFGKRPLYLLSAILFCATSAWCAASTSFNVLLFARLLQGISVSPVECLPSATITEVFFLHERAHRIGIYSFLLLSGKNLMPLASAVIIQSLGWRWTFWITMIVVAFAGVFLFLFVSETFWIRGDSIMDKSLTKSSTPSSFTSEAKPKTNEEQIDVLTNEYYDPKCLEQKLPTKIDSSGSEKCIFVGPDRVFQNSTSPTSDSKFVPENSQSAGQGLNEKIGSQTSDGQSGDNAKIDRLESGQLNYEAIHEDPPEAKQMPGLKWVRERQSRPRINFLEELKPFTGRKSNQSWLRIAFRPFILFTYPAILWSAAIYSCSIGWLIVVSESIALLFRSKNTYNFSALSSGLIYLSPFIGGILGAAGAGKFSDIIVRYMSERNKNLFEPEFRLLPTVLVSISTTIGLIGLGWSVEISDAWIVPTVFLGIISFGCTLGATTAITFCVDSYRVFAAESLVTLNFSKNVFHGFVFGLFVTKWIELDSPKTVFMWLGIIELILTIFTIPMYIFGKRARMWTARLNLMEKF